MHISYTDKSMPVNVRQLADCSSSCSRFKATDFNLSDQSSKQTDCAQSGLSLF